MPTTRLIENWLPINAVSIEAIRERAGAIPNPAPHQLHVWWARRPLAISRAAVAAALLRADAPDAMDNFYALMGTHPGVDAEQRRLDHAKSTGETLKVAYSMPRAFTHNLTDGERRWFQDNLAVPNPSVLDVTAGGGSIPFEAGRLGIPAIANELNPVAALILRATCQWPQQYGNALLDEYRAVSERFLARVRQLIADNRVYPPEPDYPQPGAQSGTQPGDDDPENQNFANLTVRLHKYVWSYLWSRTVGCPDCRGEIPLSPNWRLDGSGKGVRLLPDAGRGVCDFAIVDTAREQSPGTVARGKAVCPYPGCGATTAAGYIAAEAQAGRLGQRLYCIIVKNQWERWRNGEWQSIRRPKEYAHIPNREFRIVRPEDDNSAHIDALLAANRERWDGDNILPNENRVAQDADRVINYGITSAIHLFSPRQRLAHGYCVQAFQELADADTAAGQMTDVRHAAWGYVALGLDKFISTNSLLCRWHTNRGVIAGTFDRHDFGMKWSYSEMALSVTGLGLEWALNDLGDCIKEMTRMAGHSITKDADKAALVTPAPETANAALPSDVLCGDARMLDVDDGSVDAIVFDPPYHNNVNYAELSDFFYVWLKRTAGYVLSDDGDLLFADHLTDKVNEAIASPARFKAQADAASAGHRGKDRITAAQLATDDYQSKMDDIFRECHRVLKKDDGIMVVMFTHKSNDAWNAMTIGLIESGFNITRAWPVKTEAESSLHIRDKAAARSTILLVCRPAGRRRPKPWPVVAQKIAGAVRADVDNLRSYDLNTVDIYTASFGTALKVVSENWGTMRDTANPDRPEDPFGVTPADALEVARKEVMAFRTEQIAGARRQYLSDPLTWFYILAQDGAGGVTMPFDEANLFARAIGVELSGADARRVLESKSGRVTLKAAVERWQEGIISAARAAATPLDQAHTAIAIADRQDAEAARQWLEFNGHRWQDGEFRATLEALRKIRKAGHPDEAGARALHTLLYEEAAPAQLAMSAGEA